MQTRMKYILGFIFTLLVVSCSEDNVFNDATLDISDTTVNFSQEASEKSISIRTNVSQWSVVSPQEGTWFNLKKDGEKLVIGVEKNNLAVDRKAYAIIKSGNTVGKIEIIQAGAEEVINIGSESIILSPNASRRKVMLDANTNNIQLKAEDTPWLKITYYEGDPFFILDIENNSSLYAREGTLLISTTKGVKSISIKQDGALTLAMPVMSNVTRYTDAINYEHEKGNTLVQAPTGIFNKTSYYFYTGVKDFPRIEYRFKNSESSNFYLVLIPTTNGNLFKGDEFDQFLYTYGFVKTKSKADRIEYTNDKDHFNAFIIFDTKGGATINIEYNPQQPEDYPTFKDGIPPLRELWEYAADFSLGITGKNKADVLEYETQKGSVKNDVLSNPPSRFWFYETTEEDGSQIVARAYKFYDVNMPPERFDKDHPFVGQVSEIYGYFDNINLAYWEYDGDWKLTKEFRELLAKNNIVFLREQFGHFFYHHAESKTTFDLTPMRFANFKNGKELLVIRLYRFVETNIND